MKLAILVLLSFPLQIQCWVEGPVGVYPVDSRRALVANSDRESIMLVDVSQANVIEELRLQYHPRFANLHFNKSTKTGSYFHIVCIASCPVCDFVIVTGHELILSGGKRQSEGTDYVFRLDLAKPTAGLAHDGDRIGLADAKFTFFDSDSAEFGDLRMLEVSEDGKQAFAADHAKHVFWKFDPRQTGDSAAFEQVAIPHNESRGIHLVSDGGPRGDQLLVTSKTGIYFHDLSTDGDHCAFDLSHVCGPLQIWSAVIDPQRPDVVLASSTTDGSVIFEVIGVPCLQQKSRTLALRGRGGGLKGSHLTIDDVEHAQCNVVAGNREQKGFRDGVGQEVLFTRPHHMRLIPDQTRRLLLSDLDNQALRIIVVRPGANFGSISTAFWIEQSHHRQTSSQKCAELGWQSLTSSVCGQMLGEQGSWNDADERCVKAGGRLCTGSEVSEKKGAAIWTASVCRPCWHSYPNVDECEDYRLTESVYNNASGGHILVKGEDVKDFLCAPDAQRASVLCCADV